MAIDVNISSYDKFENLDTISFPQIIDFYNTVFNDLEQFENFSKDFQESSFKDEIQTNLSTINDAIYEIGDIIEKREESKFEANIFNTIETITTALKAINTLSA